MSFTQSLVDFRDGITYDEKTHALAMAKGITNFVVKGLDLTGTTLTSGIFSNTGTFAHLGKEGETHTITANFTGYIIIKTTLSGSSSTSVIEESSTREDTDPRDTSNIKYFTIYELNNGVIVQDFRHINYVKSFYLKNMGGNNIAWVLNGFTSETFDASALAGNRTLLSNIDIGYDDTIHANTLIQDILKDMFLKTQTLIGSDKPFILNFSDLGLYLPNFITKLNEFLNERYGPSLPSGSLINFKMETATYSAGTDFNSNNGMRCTAWGDEFYYEFPFDYDNWDDIHVKDVRGNPSNSLELLWMGNTNSAPILLTKSLKLYDYIIVVTAYWGGIPIQVNKSHTVVLNNTTSAAYSDHVKNLSTIMSCPDGLNLILFADSLAYTVVWSSTNGTPTTSGQSILEIYGGYN